MAIRVTTSPDINHQDFIEATGWVVDDHGYLHVTVVAKGNVATFRPEAWRSVERFDVHPDVVKKARAIVERADKADK